ncbi:MAG: signal peptidase I [Bacteroidetes bacterium]|nr:MAG: signal peptidase I [Bacteroidota bacterium]
MALSSGRKKKKAPYLQPGIREWLKAFLIAFFILIILRFFVFDFKSLSDSSMEKSLLQGDILLINKYNYGTRMPMRIIPQSWVNRFFSTDSLPPVRHLPYWRLPGNQPPDYNDMVYLNIPAPHTIAIDKRTRTIKRIVALPGDVLQMKDAVLFINGKPHDNPPELQFNYLIEFRRNDDVEAFFERYTVKEGTRVKGRNQFVFPFTVKMADSIAAAGDVRRIQKFASATEDDFFSPFGAGARNWTQDNFGPLTIPYREYSVLLNTRTLDEWRYLLIYHERVDIEVKNDSVFVDGKYAESYTFAYDYYFLLGDNRHNTSDSRLWGLVPESHIIGRASSVFLSFDKNAGLLNKFRWKRFFRSLDTPN